MAKLKKAFFCKNCGYESQKWMGKCPSCAEWNTFDEEIISRGEPSVLPGLQGKTYKPVAINEIQSGDFDRLILNDNELNRVLGGGLVAGSLTLFGGEPGIGKSTLLLQTALNNPSLRVLYVSGEESEQQIKMRAERIGISNPNCFILTATSTHDILNQVGQVNPNLIVIDSIQTLYTPLLDSSPGSISQIRECTAELMRFAKESNVPVMLIGHITKDGTIAGPKVLEHMVDTVLQFEGDRNHLYRLIRAQKNRFGSTNELAIYEMVGAGLREVSNPSELLISNHSEPLSGVAIAAASEGLRPLLIEVQALVSTAAYGTPQRSATGFDTKRLNMLLAVLEKRCGFRLSQKDVFLNLAGGIRMDDPAIDLAVVCAILSSNVDMPLPADVCFCAEIGLSGELRPVNRTDQRIAEAEKLGYKRIMIASATKGISQKDFDIRLLTANKMEEVFQQLFGGQGG